MNDDGLGEDCAALADAVTVKEAPLASADESAVAAVTELAHKEVPDCSATLDDTGKPVASKSTCEPFEDDEPAPTAFAAATAAAVLPATAALDADIRPLSCSILMSDLSSNMS
jgi:hypothetical protein